MIGVSHHVPDPGPGFVEEDYFEETTALVQLVGSGPNDVPVSFVLRGPSEAHVFFEGPSEGDAFDDDDNGLDEVETELISLDLTDGAVSLRLRPGRRSPGEIEEQENNTAGRLDVRPFTQIGRADSFFDVFFEIQIVRQLRGLQR